MPQKRSLIINKLKTYISEQIVHALNRLGLPLNEFSLSPPKQDDFGDLSTNIAMTLSGLVKTSPLEIAKNILKDLLENGLDNIKDVTVTPPGFINFIVHSSFYQNKIKSIIKDGENFGKDNIGKGKSANVEFVSANPTGPLTIGHGRNAVLGDTVSNILEWHGYQVIREYYYYDAGKQMRMLGKSVASRYFELLNKASDFPEQGYQGEYIIDIAKRVLDKFGKELDEDDERFLTEAEGEIFQQIE